MRHERWLAVLAIFAVTSCAASCGALAEHTRLEPWEAGLDAFTDRPEEWLPAAVCTVATPIFLIEDQATSGESVEDHVFNSNTKYGDELAIGLGVAPVAWGTVDALAGGDGTLLAASTETLLLTMGSTYLLKSVINRQRPDDSTYDSFPSAHTSFAFAGATLLARRWEEDHEGSWLGYLLYLPASYVGISRLEGQRHFLSDVSFGAALGMFWAHVVYDAHTVDGGFGKRDRAAWEIGPVADERGIAFGVGVSF